MALSNSLGNVVMVSQSCSYNFFGYFIWQ